MGARTKETLDSAEGALVVARAIQLVDHPIRTTGDLDECRAIHRQLSQDFYPWAGEVRTVDLWKNVDGAEHFLSVGAIDRGSMFAADELCKDNLPRGMKRDQFIDRLTHHYDQWNAPTHSAKAMAELSGCSGVGSRPMFDQVVFSAGTPADSSSALERFAIRSSMSIDEALDAACIAGRIAHRRRWRSRRSGHVVRRRSGRPTTGRVGTRAPTSVARSIVMRLRALISGPRSRVRDRLKCANTVGIAVASASRTCADPSPSGRCASIT